MCSDEPLSKKPKGNKRIPCGLYVVVDVETTGLSPQRGDRVIEIGAVALEADRAIREFHALINPGKRISIAAQQVHGITDQMLRGQPKPDEVFPRFRTFVGDGALVAHNAAFDLRFLRHEFGLLGAGLTNPSHCTLEISRMLFPRLRDHKLETVYRHLFRDTCGVLQRHRALDDARMVAKVWMELMKRWRI